MKNNKNNYEIPTIEVIEINDDVITTSFFDPYGIMGNDVTGYNPYGE